MLLVVQWVNGDSFMLFIWFMWLYAIATYGSVTHGLWFIVLFSDVWFIDCSFI